MFKYWLYKLNMLRPDFGLCCHARKKHTLYVYTSYIQTHMHLFLPSLLSLFSPTPYFHNKHTATPQDIEFSAVFLTYQHPQPDLHFLSLQPQSWLYTVTLS